MVVILGILWFNAGRLKFDQHMQPSRIGSSKWYLLLPLHQLCLSPGREDQIMPFLAFVVVLVAIIYPIQGSCRGGGWLSEAGFSDFAGSTLVHSVGGCSCVSFGSGARKGKYQSDGSVQPIPVPTYLWQLLVHSYCGSVGLVLMRVTTSIRQRCRCNSHLNYLY